MLTAGCANLEQPTGESHGPEIQVVGSATIEKAPEVFTVQAEIVEHAKTRVEALAAVATRLDKITSGVGALPGLAGYSVKSTEAGAEVTRPQGCDVSGRSYSETPRPKDCSPIDAVATVGITLEGSPADAAGIVISFLTQTGVETASLKGFDVKDHAAADQEAKQAALANAVSTAQALAAQAKVRIRQPSTIRYGDVDRFQEKAFGASGEQAIVVTGARIANTPIVTLNLKPTPVRFSAEVAVTFAIAGDVAQK
jgi:uncharacterized protein YggE